MRRQRAPGMDSLIFRFKRTVAYHRPRTTPRASVAERGACSRLQMESTMPSFQLSAPSTQAIPRPPCPKCGTTMTLARITPHGSGYERTFECPSCDQTEKEIIKFI
jgi:hypothetical protein